jgi:S1-C subfamily serine protease
MASVGTVRSYAALVAAAALGGGLAVGAVALLGGLDSGTTTVVTETSAPEVTEQPARPGRWMTVGEIYEHAAPGVVQIASTTSNVGVGSGDTSALGSGFVVDKAGHIVTSYHVVEGATQIRVSFSNRDTVGARLVGTDPTTDLAVLKVEAGSDALTPLPLGNSDKVAVGDPVVAIGNPFGLDRTATAGIVSALQREITAPNPRFAIDHVIQTDAPINRGNSGGPLLNVRGQVIGVNTQIETGVPGMGGNVGIGFAVPSNTVKDVVAQLLQTGRVDHAYLGISGHAVNADLARQYNLPVRAGVLVEDVLGDTGASEAGLEAGETRVVLEGVTYIVGGDIIVAVDDTSVVTPQELRDAIAQHNPGDEVDLTIYRDGERTSVTVTLGRRPLSPTG